MQYLENSVMTKRETISGLPKRRIFLGKRMDRQVF
jgi:hypothetical protein